MATNVDRMMSTEFFGARVAYQRVECVENPRRRMTARVTSYKNQIPGFCRSVDDKAYMAVHVHKKTI